MGGACLSSVPEPTDVTWSFRIGECRTEWDWSGGPPDLQQLQPFRRPASGAASRHVPVRAFSHTVEGYIELESGLEHDLLRVLDRNPSVRWIVSQPFRLSWCDPRQRGARRHTPDLLSVGVDGSGTVWDVKSPASAVSDRFVSDSNITRRACDQREWRYEVFTGLTSAHRHNLLWLHSYRRRPAWTGSHEDELLAAAAGGVLLGELLPHAEDDERATVLWHLIWTGRLVVDLAKRFSPETEVTA